ncbi:hypothetical protein [Streptomyces fuscichromogenes]|uniref:hypothetical protein n=1 Tax=Streptomyces fuscichromogenes TaxID=1324013 RepID=UPI0016705D70|nr:hypothetical protein [Streptomyces fuscichromogenes]
MSAAVVEALALAQALAARQGRAQVTTGHLLDALLRVAEAPASHAGVMLRAQGHAPDELGRDRPRGTAAPGGVRSRAQEPPPPDPAVHEVLRDLDSWTVVTGDRRATTLHLLAALSRSTAAEGVFLREAGLGSDTVLAVGARCRGDVRGEDAAFAAGRRPEGDATVLAIPPAPRPDDLVTRTTGRRSASVARLLSGQLPESGRMNTRLGVVRVRSWVLGHAAHYLITLAAVLLLVDEFIGTGDWTLLVCVPLVPLQLSLTPWTVWVAARAVALWLTPAPLPWLVLGASLLEVLVVRDELWMKRVDLGRPGLPLRYFRLEYWRELRSMIEARMFGDDEN